MKAGKRFDVCFWGRNKHRLQNLGKIPGSHNMVVWKNIQNALT